MGCGIEDSAKGFHGIGWNGGLSGLVGMIAGMEVGSLHMGVVETWLHAQKLKSIVRFPYEQVADNVAGVLPHTLPHRSSLKWYIIL